MKTTRLLLCIAVTSALTVDSWARWGAGSGTGYMGGGGATEAPGGGEEGGGQSGSVEGPTGDHGSVTGELYGDLYAILRYQGGETKNVPAVDAEGNPVWETVTWTCPDGHQHPNVQQQAWASATAIGGEPTLTENFVAYKVVDEDTQQEVPFSENPLCYWWPAPTPSQCVQPVADYARWGDLSSEENADTHPELASVEFNRIPLVMTYDPTWDRTEAAVGTVDDNGLVTTHFVEPEGTWWDPKNGEVTYTDGVLWADLIQEVSFGRMNSVRSPDAVTWSSFDEAIRSINDAVAIRLDASGRLLLTKNVYDEYLVDPATGEPLFLYTVDKAIDSPLENGAVYLKLMRDGHLVTPGDERQPVDRSEMGGIPLDQLLGLEDGPSTALRPTIDIAKMREWGLHHLVDVVEETYYTYYDEDNVLQVTTTVPSGEEYETWVGIPTSSGSVPEGDDFTVCASALAAAADKGGKFTVDHVVYLNSILGINKVVGTSEDGTIDYSKNPQYFNYGGMHAYDREAIFTSRGWYDPDETPAPGGDPAAPGSVLLLGLPEEASQGDSVEGIWMEGLMSILDYVPFRELGVADDTRAPINETATFDIAGFTQGADDDLSVIEFVHTYQVPDNR